MIRRLPTAFAAFVTLGAVIAAQGQTDGVIASKGGDTILIRQISDARIRGDSGALVEAMDQLAARFPDRYGCVAERLEDEDTWPHAGFEENEAFRRFLVDRLAEQGVVAGESCFLVWTDHVRIDMPETQSDPLQLAEMDLEDKRAVLMQLALYAPYERSLFDRLIHLAGVETQPEAQELALMAAARLLGRASGHGDDEAGALMTLLRQRAQQPSTRAGAAEIAGVVLARVPSLNLVVLAQYLGDDPDERAWALDVWQRTDLRHLDEKRGQRVVDALLDSSVDGEFRWTEAAVLAHVEPLNGLVHPSIVQLLESPEEADHARGVQWAAATRIRPVEMLPRIIQLYETDTPHLRATCLWGIAEISASTERYEEVVVLLPAAVEDLHHPEATVRDAAADLLKRLVGTQCRHPGRFAGLDGVLPALTAQLDDPDDARRERVVDLLRRVRSDCLPVEVRRDIER